MRSGVDQAVDAVGMGDGLVWFLVGKVKEAFEAEGLSLSGEELVGRFEETNAALRTAWPFVEKYLETMKDSRLGMVG